MAPYIKDTYRDYIVAPAHSALALKAAVSISQGHIYRPMKGVMWPCEENRAHKGLGLAKGSTEPRE